MPCGLPAYNMFNVIVNMYKDAKSQMYNLS